MDEPKPPLFSSKDNHHHDEMEVKTQAKRVLSQAELLEGKTMPDKIKVKLTPYFKAVDLILESELKGPILNPQPTSKGSPKQST